FAILAPSSSVIPLTGELVAEHRMYLASAPLIALVVLATQRILSKSGLIGLTFLLAPILLTLTRARNEEWASARTIWQRATEVRPTNARAWNSLGVALEGEGEQAAAAEAWQEALAHKPDDYHAHGNLGEHYANLNEGARAISHYRSAVSSSPDHLELRFNLGSLLLRTGDPVGAEEQLSQALQRAPEDWELREIAERRLARARARR
ncbi:MAG: tetratricopeptide repeat protein, partial [Planctomycetes bacterium]|nr:tetratricopeptide repeat protein [Planctomycetota bacterium]